ncbi:response regulator [Gloeocapsopsis sp. IPPAS B-1203]|uniref:response regulator n=1 Tax=Gloeocapsopsis sp. IPPAS B-1203 TaxID=2049454 RepID=UPI000C19DA24|nr:response regulator [Gloeocapsopsis sp. IPPAS B-1203]PIG93135.1 two-component system response regulator [Gloeocapsopsis sp. IPPAS B-1203]
MAEATQTLLVIEDSDEDFAAFERILRKASINNVVYRCVDGDEALDFLRHNGQYQDRTKAPRPGIILLDLNLPGTDGREVLEQIKQDSELKMIPVVVFTTSSNPKDIEVCYQCGVNGYILKPIDVKKLMRTVQVLIDYWFEAVILPNSVRG